MVGGARAVARCDALGGAPYSDMPDGLYRGYLTPAYAAAQDALAGWMADAGMTVRRDPAANLIGHYAGTDVQAPALLIGSHLDSVRDGGRYDGPLGILLGIEAVAALHAAGRRMRFPIEVIAFGDEEGSRFPAAMLTSRAVAGTLDVAALEVADADGVTLAEALATLPPFVLSEVEAQIPGAALAARASTSLSTNGDEDALAANRHPSASWGLPGEGASAPQKTPASAGVTAFGEARIPEALAYLEAHIEQGPVLEAEGLAVGTVTGIAAQLRLQASVIGVAGHAGTASMPLRRDALAGAAEMMLAIERIARADASDLVATVGRIEALPGAANVIPGTVRFTIDIRSGDPARRDRAAEAILDAIAAIADARGLDFDVDHIHDLPASPCDPALMDLLDAATAAAGQPMRRLVSGAGHDAMVMAALCPTAMLFVRCRGGISHNPAEHVDPADAEIALRVMLGFIERLGDAA
ncbi:Zn-dependent hydrolase [Sphingomonas sp. H39-1-10]|uniref:Zn-dependent hydrolase n=1 Tax=Sphingomonas pollutisoli TaxID=3030829 RepID=UPI0023B8A23C|nr:Zn-dependent hydrolase [Sphingomonas pollutisoli]MDF0489689.1 Zn-dependent hydrolase [Sphingomonas pollutisoli]